MKQMANLLTPANAHQQRRPRCQSPLNTYALSEMIQWIWRTQIRNGEPVCVYMPSKKMRVIVERWLGVD